MNWCVSLLALVPSRPFSVFSSMFVGDGKWFFPLPHSPLPRSPSLPLFPLHEAKEGEGLGGAGLPLGTAVAQSISPKPRKFLLPKRKEKKKKKKIPAATFPPCPIGTVKTGSVGFLGGWLRAGTLSGKSGGAPWQALRQAHFGLLPSPHFFPPPSDPPEVAFPGPRARGAQWGCGPALGRVGSGALALHTVAAARLPQSWASPSMSCCGDVRSLLRSLCHLLPPLQVEGRADPSTGRGEGRETGHRLSAPRGQLGNRDTSFSVLGVFV